MPLTTLTGRQFATRPSWLAFVLLQIVLFALPYLTWPPVESLPASPAIIEEQDGHTSVIRPPVGPVPHMAGRIRYADFSPTCQALVIAAAYLNTLPLAVTEIVFIPFRSQFLDFTRGIVLS